MANLKTYQKLLKHKTWKYGKWMFVFQVYNQTDRFLSDAEECVFGNCVEIESITPEQIASAVGQIKPVLKYQR